jgi:uncharacterized protein YdhG (YjbR/CyaY superfamily)
MERAHQKYRRLQRSEPRCFEATLRRETNMSARAAAPASIDEYIAAFPPPTQAVLRRIRATIAAASPGAREVISYRMPAFAQNGILLYFAAFKAHIGVFPPVSGDARLESALSPYRGPKGNLRFPLDEPIPYGLIRRIAALRVRQDRARAGAARGGRRAAAGRAAPEKPRRKPTPRKAASGGGRKTRGRG